MKIKRHFTRKGQDPFGQFSYEVRNSRILDPSASVVFEMPEVEVPSGWSQVATDILAQKYFRSSGVPGGAENSAKQVVKRMADCWRYWGEKSGYFDSPADADAFRDEVAYMILAQIAAPNSPQWFNTGLYHSYGIKGRPQGNWYVDEKSGRLKKSTTAWERPQPHACFILSVKDDLLRDGGILDLWHREARIFKFGSGSGSNYSAIRGIREPLSHGGHSSGLMSFLKAGDRAAGAVKSGEEDKVIALAAAGYSSGFEGEAYQTVSGQNSNNSVRIPDSFFRILDQGGDWPLISRTSGETISNIPAQEIWDAIAGSAWRCGDPGLQFHTTINEWHTCPASGPILASNPCSEYMFLDDSACNLSSLNLLKFWMQDEGIFDTVAFEHSCRLWTIVLEISVVMAQFPTRQVARNSFDFRTLGLGFCNLGSLLMHAALPYGSEKAQALAGGISALMTAVAYRTSAELSHEKGPFRQFRKNREAMLRVIRNHRTAVYNEPDGYRGLSIRPKGLEAQDCPAALLESARKAWDEALELGEKYGFRNAQVTAIAPTGTIGLIMDCDTTGIEPDYSLVKTKILSGGGQIRIANQSVLPALKKLGYSESACAGIVKYIENSGTMEGAPYVRDVHLDIFDCANSGGAGGNRILSHFSHLKMMAAVQPFISGAISKTVNLPLKSLPVDISLCYRQAWEMGLKSCSVYRDGCKQSQPLVSGRKQSAEAGIGGKTESYRPAISSLLSEDEILDHAEELLFSSTTTEFKRKLSRIIEKKRLPRKRNGFTQKAKINGNTVFVRTGEYEGGTLGEIFIDMHREGVAFRSLLNYFAISVSIGLQYGVPLEEFSDKFTFTRFEPEGIVDHPNIKSATSIVDYVFRLLSFEYLGRHDLVHVRNEPAGINKEHLISVITGDSPTCPICGHTTIRSGTCYRCLNCGNSLGCS